MIKLVLITSSQNLLRQVVDVIYINSFQKNLFRLLAQEELHLVGKCKQSSNTTDVEISEFDNVLYVVFCIVFQVCLHPLYFNCQDFNFNRHTFAFYPDKKVKLKARIYISRERYTINRPSIFQ